MGAASFLSGAFSLFIEVVERGVESNWPFGRFAESLHKMF